LSTLLQGGHPLLTIINGQQIKVPDTTFVGFKNILLLARAQ